MRKVRKKGGLYFSKLSRYCIERSIIKNSAMQAPRHKKNIFKNSLEMYLVIIVMEKALRCWLASHYILDFRFRNADCGE
jgi:hypothetical protein